MTRVAVVVTLLALLLGIGCERQEEHVVIGGPPEGDAATEDAPAETAGTEEVQEMAWTITSPAFVNGETIPAMYTADGENVSPPLIFSDVPEGTVELALICHDPDAPRAGGWTHWVVYGMAPDIGGLPELVPPELRVEQPELMQGVNSGDKVGYRGPSPPPGAPHRYQFRGYALSEPLGLDPGATKDELEAAMAGKVIGEAMLEGLYGR